MIRVRLEILIFLSGFIWSIIGVLLNCMAVGWLIKLDFFERIISVSIGIVLGVLISYFGFIRMIRINTYRIMKYEKRACVFAFQSWKSYVIFVIMVTMGFFMRSSGIVPKLILTPVYMGIGLALFLSSIKYYKTFLVLLRNRKAAVRS
jgi:hypothetical protein